MTGKPKKISDSRAQGDELHQRSQHAVSPPPHYGSLDLRLGLDGFLLDQRNVGGQFPAHSRPNLVFDLNVARRLGRWENGENLWGR